MPFVADIQKMFGRIFPKKEDNDEANLSQEQAEDLRTERNDVALWTQRVRNARTFFESDFKRMKENMEFAAGLQWAGQTTIAWDDYIANWTNREVQSKVASLYAKDPKAIARVRDRLNYRVWDGKLESLQAARVLLSSGQQTPELMAAQALVNDFEMGQQWKQLVEKVGRSMEVCYQVECDTQTPDFKYQMKQLVRRTVTTGTGFVRLDCVRVGEKSPDAIKTDDSVSMRMKRAKFITEKLAEGKIQQDDPQVVELQQLVMSIQASVQDGDLTNVEEHLEFSFPSSTSIIVDPHCKSLKGFIGARWIAQQTILPIEDVNAYYETNVKVGGQLVEYADTGMEKVKTEPDKKKDVAYQPMCCHWEIFDIVTKTRFVVVDGW